MMGNELFRAVRELGQMVLTVTLTFAGCLGGSGSLGTGAPATPLGQFENDAAEALCGEDVRRCCTMYGAAYLGPSCRQLIGLLLQAIAASAEASAQRSGATGATYDPAAGADCLALLRGQVRACDVDPNVFGFPSPAATPNPCTRFVTGAVAVGATCGSHHECAPLAGGGQLVTCEQGTCQAHRKAGGGEFCASGAICSDPANAVCRADSTTCGPPAEAGARCNEPDDCAAPADCCVSGACRPRVGLGQPCGGGCAAGATFGNCTPGLACKDGTCVQALRIGESCDSTLQPCEGGSACGPADNAKSKYVCQFAHTPPACEY